MKTAQTRMTREQVAALRQRTKGTPNGPQRSANEMGFLHETCLAEERPFLVPCDQDQSYRLTDLCGDPLFTSQGEGE